MEQSMTATETARLIDWLIANGHSEFVPQKRGDIMSPRTGRPTDNPKGQSIHVRLDAKSEEILAKYTTQEKVSRAEAVRRGIEKLEDDIKK